jgi:transposase
MANGDTPFKPVVIFHGKGTVASRENYNPRVDVHFNETAYNNEKLFSQWLKDVYIPYADGDNNMMVMDVATFHKTEGILGLLKSNNILPAIIPPEFISLLQPLDTAINGPFKKQLQIQSEAYLDKLEEIGSIPNKWTIRYRREIAIVIVG